MLTPEANSKFERKMLPGKHPVSVYDYLWRAAGRTFIAYSCQPIF
jgi:hypothetical protein